MTWVQILRIVREHKDESVNIFLNKSREFFSYYKMRQNSTIFGFCQNSVNRISFFLSKNNYF